LIHRIAVKKRNADANEEDARRENGFRFRVSGIYFALSNLSHNELTEAQVGMPLDGVKKRAGKN
jgi:hypothetical protein